MGEHSDSVMEVLEQEYPNGVSFDLMTLRLLRKKISITDEKIEELRRCMFQLGDQRWFSSVMVSGKTTQLKLLTSAVAWLEKHGCFSLERLLEKYAGELKHISTVEQFSVYLQHLDFGFDVRKTAKGGVYCLLSSLKECLATISSQLESQVDEAGGELSLDEIECAFPYLTADALEDIRSGYLSEEVYVADSSGVILWRSSELLHLPEDFAEKVTDAVDTLVELSESITVKKLEFALNLLFRSRFREEHALQDDGTFKRICAEHYRGRRDAISKWKKSKTSITGKKRKRRTNTSFSSIGIPVGAELTFSGNVSFTCTVLDGKNRVEYEGASWELSPLAKHLLDGLNVSGFCYFCHQGETLWDRRLRLERENQSVPVIAAQLPGSTESEIIGLEGQLIKSGTWKAYKAAGSNMRAAEWVQRIDQGETIQDISRETTYAISTVKQMISNHRLYFKVCELNGIDPEGGVDV